MSMAQKHTFHAILGCIFSCVVHFGRGDAGALRSATAEQNSQAVVKDLLAGGSTQAHVHSALQAERVRLMQEAPQGLRLSLANLGLPVPPEIRDLAAQAAASKKVTPAQADHAAKMLNKMIEEQHWLLDNKVIDCREKRRRAGEAIQDAAKAVRDLASETSSARSIIVEATSRIPQDRRSFEEFKVEAQSGRRHCQDARSSDKVETQRLQRDAIIVAAVQQALTRQCKGRASFAQEQKNDANDSAEDAKQSLREAQGELNPSVTVPSVEAMDPADCPAMAANLGVVARRHSGHAAVTLLQSFQPVRCKLGPQTCAAMLDAAAEVEGEIADSQARLRASAARAREACKDEDLFAKNQLSMETSQVADRSRELGEATFKAGAVGELTNQKDSERQKMQADLKAATAKCEKDTSDILYGKMCALQKVRDSLQLLAGRSELPEDCQVSDWEAGMCSATCGGGMKKLSRKVTLSAKGGAACPPLQLNLRCGETVCPKECEVSRWTTWSACSAQCNGGIQERNRVVSSNPLGNGVGCPHLVDMRLCNTESCTSDCTLLQWTSWSPCSQACGSGAQTRARGLRDEGRASCPAAGAKERLEHRHCNKKKCDDSKEVKCAGAPLDIVLLLDASGSITERGFTTLKALSLELVHRYSPSNNGTKMAVAAFAKQSTAVSALSGDASELSTRIASHLRWLKGPGNAGAGLSRAMSLLPIGGRKKATSLVLMITDGRLVDPFLARQAAEKLKNSGVRLAFAVVGTDYKNSELLKGMASLPEKSNFIQLPDLKQLPAFLKWAARRIVANTCSAVV